jgi:peptidyl-prolyl cis-trans isomerase C
MSKNMRSTVAIIAIFSVIAFSAGCEFGKKGWVAKIGSSKISTDEFNARIQTYPANMQEALKDPKNQEAVLDQLINEKVLLLEAQKQGLSKNEDYKKQVAELEKQFENAKKQGLINLLIQDKVKGKVNVTKEDVINYYNQNQAQFKSYEQRRARHILLKSEEDAKAVLAELKSGKDFAQVAREKSQDPTAQSGGDLGFFKRGDLVPAFEQAVFSMKKGELSGIVKTQFGFHVVQLTDVVIVPQPTTDQAYAQIQRSLEAQKQNAALTEYLNTLKTSYKISKNLEAAVKSEDKKEDKKEEKK